MSLGGIAIAIRRHGRRCDVMIEGLPTKKKLAQEKILGQKLEGTELMEKSFTKCGDLRSVQPCLSACLSSLCRLFGFHRSQEPANSGRSFTRPMPLAAAQGCRSPLASVLRVIWIRGKIPDELAIPINRGTHLDISAALEPCSFGRKLTIRDSHGIFRTALLADLRLGWGVFLPPLDEVTCCTCQRAVPGLSVQKASGNAAQDDALIKRAEVKPFSAKAGRRHCDRPQR